MVKFSLKPSSNILIKNNKEKERKRVPRISLWDLTKERHKAWNVLSTGRAWFPNISYHFKNKSTIHELFGAWIPTNRSFISLIALLDNVMPGKGYFNSLDR